MLFVLCRVWDLVVWLFGDLCLVFVFLCVRYFVFGVRCVLCVAVSW